MSTNWSVTQIKFKPCTPGAVELFSIEQAKDVALNAP